MSDTETPWWRGMVRQSIKVTKAEYERIVEMLEKPARPTAALVRLMRGKKP